MKFNQGITFGWNTHFPKHDLKVVCHFPPLRRGLSFDYFGCTLSFGYFGCSLFFG